MSKQWLIAIPVFLVGAFAVIWLFVSTDAPATITSFGSRIADANTLEVTDLVPENNKPVVHRARFDVRTGAKLGETTEPAVLPGPTPPLCTSVHHFEHAGKSLRTAPHYGDPEYSAGGLVDPPNTKTVDVVMQPLGFMASATDLEPWIVGDGDGLLIYDHGAGIGRYDVTGRQLWLRALGAQCEMAMRVGTDTLVVATSDSNKRLVAIDLATGAVKWTKSTTPAEK